MNLQVATVAAWVAIIPAIGVVAIAVFQYDRRLTEVEEKVNILIALPSVGGLNEPTEDGLVSPMERACAEIALKAASALESGDRILTGGPLERLYENLGCK